MCCYARVVYSLRPDQRFTMRHRRLDPRLVIRVTHRCEQALRFASESRGHIPLLNYLHYPIIVDNQHGVSLSFTRYPYHHQLLDPLLSSPFPIFTSPYQERSNALRNSRHSCADHFAYKHHSIQYSRTFLRAR